MEDMEWALKHPQCINDHGKPKFRCTHRNVSKPLPCSNKDDQSLQMCLLGPWQTPQTMFWRRASPKCHCPGCSRVWRRASLNALRWGVSAGVDCPHQQNVKINVFWRLSLMLPVFWITEYASSIAPVVLSGVESVACIGNNSIHPLNLLWCIQGHFFGFSRESIFFTVSWTFFMQGMSQSWFPDGTLLPHRTLKHCITLLFLV